VKQGTALDSGPLAIIKRKAIELGMSAVAFELIRLLDEPGMPGALYIENIFFGESRD
jgi:hypothetical protein